MHINVTLVLQMLVFIAFVWFTMRFVWPPLVRAMDDRQAKIADGLAAAERGRRELELAQHRIVDEMKQAKAQAAELIEKANARAMQIIEQAKTDARGEALQLAKVAQDQIQVEVGRAKQVLREQLASLVVAGAEKILTREINVDTHQALINQMIEEL